MPHQIEIRPAEQVGDVRLLAGEEIIEADHVVPLLHQPLAEVRAEKTGPAGDQNAFEHVLLGQAARLPFCLVG